jgi:hypothetical protein
VLCSAILLDTANSNTINRLIANTVSQVLLGIIIQNLLILTADGRPRSTLSIGVNAQLRKRLTRQAKLTAMWVQLDQTTMRRRYQRAFSKAPRCPSQNRAVSDAPGSKVGFDGHTPHPIDTRVVSFFMYIVLLYSIIVILLLYNIAIVSIVILAHCAYAVRCKTIVFFAVDDSWQ